MPAAKPAPTPEPAPAPAPAPAPEPAPALDIAALTAAPEAREPNYRVSGPRLAFGDYALTNGVSTKGEAKGTPHLVLVNGRSQTGFSHAAIAVALMEGLIPRATVRALWAAADAR